MFLASFAITVWYFGPGPSYNWLRPVDVRVSTGTILSLPVQANTDWRRDDANVPPLQHSPFVFNANYSDIRYVQATNEKFQVSNGKGIAFSQYNGADSYVSSFRFTPDLQNFFYVLSSWDTANDSPKYQVVNRHWTSDKYDEVSQPVFSQDGEHIAFTGQKDLHSIIKGVPTMRIIEAVVDGQALRTHDVGEADEFNALNPLHPSVAFNPVTHKVVYILNDRDDGNWQKKESYVMSDARKLSTYPHIGSVPQFSEDGSLFAYIVDNIGSYYTVNPTISIASVVCNENEGPEFAFIKQVALSKDGTVCAYIGDNPNYGEKSAVVTNGKIFQSSDEDYSNLTLSADGKSIAFVHGVSNGYSRIRLNTIESEPYNQIESITLAPGNTIAFVAYDEKHVIPECTGSNCYTFRARVHVGPAASASFSTISKPVLSEDLHLAAYIAKRESYAKSEVFVGTTEVGSFDDVWPLTFSGTTLVFGARNGNNLQRVSVSISERS